MQTASTKSITSKAAIAFMSSDLWTTATCGRCGATMERGGGYRDVDGVVGLVDIVCHDCIYKHDAAAFKRDGVLQGGSLSSAAMLRYDFEVYRPFFDAECMLTPTLQAVWEKYRTVPALNDKHIKRAILVNTTTGFVFTRDWSDDFAVVCKDKVAPTDLVIEIFDGMCGYVGIDVYYFGRDGGMWAQGKVRETGAQAWYGTCCADMPWLTKVNEALRAFIGLPVGYSLYKHGVRLPVGFFGTLDVFGGEQMATQQAWKHAEDNVRAYLSTSYGIPEFQPDWVRGSGFRPMTMLAIRENVSKNRAARRRD